MMTSRQARILEEWVELARIAPKQGLLSIGNNEVQISGDLFREMFKGEPVEIIAVSDVLGTKMAHCKTVFDGAAVVALLPVEGLAWAV